MSDTHEPKAWVGCLGCYNAGRLVGEWVDGKDADEYEPHDALGSSVRMPDVPPCGRTEGADEKWVMDHEDYGGLLTGECSPSEAARLAEVVERIDSEWYDAEAVAAWAGNTGHAYADLDDLSYFEEAYEGEWDSELAYAENFADDIGMLSEVSESIAMYFDYEKFARDLFLGDYWSAEAPGGMVYVFRSN